MTEDEMRNDPDYLRGRIDLLEAMIDNLIYLLPLPALRSLETSFKRSSEDIQRRRDADPGHIDWDMWERSHHPKERPPAVTLHAKGYLSYIESWRPALEELISVRDEEKFSVLAATPEAIKQDADWQEYLNLPPEDQ
ncbi:MULTISPECIES: hypothetical protein [Rhizobium/Agrobacterium group]|uniref:hypothetical protein n=1 Tax=Rhizobium/Agrobacterium group TaxID=227290 RepID=UPI0023006C90|nr:MULTISPECIES: hypothetical protein [Rhizobium/Agrobacterium group]MDA5633399.1 hypothetical protein [Agrobacterium sp. ST15.16.024]MDF1889043.1 hypothetical protein [Rhizobium rhizogenes]